MNLKKLGKKKIGEILIEEGLLAPKDLERALEVQKKEGGLIGGILVKMGLVTEEDLLAALAKQLPTPFLRLSRYNVNRNALKLIPRQVAEKYVFFPFEEENDAISVAMADPLNQEAVEAIEKRVPFRLQIFLASPTEIREMIGLYYSPVPVEAKDESRK